MDKFYLRVSMIFRPTRSPMPAVGNPTNRRKSRIPYLSVYKATTAPPKHSHATILTKVTHAAGGGSASGIGRASPTLSIRRVFGFDGLLHTGDEEFDDAPDNAAEQHHDKDSTGTLAHKHLPYGRHTPRTSPYVAARHNTLIDRTQAVTAAIVANM
jgi:hypothetical protein